MGRSSFQNKGYEYLKEFLGDSPGWYISADQFTIEEGKSLYFAVPKRSDSADPITLSRTLRGMALRRPMGFYEVTGPDGRVCHFWVFGYPDFLRKLGRRYDFPYLSTLFRISTYFYFTSPGGVRIFCPTLESAIARSTKLYRSAMQGKEHPEDYAIVIFDKYGDAVHTVSSPPTASVSE